MKAARSIASRIANITRSACARPGSPRAVRSVSHPTPPDQALRVAALLSAAGGFLDAFTWVAHGGVFANAQTGNVVLLGVFAATGRFPDALHHVPPIVAFLLGVFVAHRLRLRGARIGGQARVARFSLGVEIVLLMVVAVLPASFPDLPIVLGIAFVAALQSSSFSRVEGFAYSSVMTTGNLRRMAKSFFAGVTSPRDRAALRPAWVFAAICLSFAAGTAAGAFATMRLANVAVIVPIALLAAAFGLCMLDRQALRDIQKGNR